jgi:DNA-binding SARP family transcriptional activator
MELALLGPVRATVSGRALDLGPRKRRLLLALLGLSVGTVVQVDRLVSLMWDGELPPPGAVGTVRAHVSRLRQAGVPLDTVGAGYRLALPPDSVDVVRFSRLVRDGRSAEALALWRGPALVDVASASLRSRLCGALEESRLSALASSMSADLARGRHRSLVSPLTELVDEDPARFVGPLMLALYRSGRQADALALYQRVRALVVSEYGTALDPEVERLHSAILGGDPALDLSSFPADPPLTGRTAELEALDELLPDGGLSIALLVGPAGVGKTALAVHWAHRVRDQFPDGLLYVEVGAEGPLAALGSLLDGLGVSEPLRSLDQAASLYRSVLADRRVLVLLDDVSTVAQVRPLLPGSPGSFVLVTSRAQLGGLVAREGAFRMVLG